MTVFLERIYKIKAISQFECTLSTALKQYSCHFFSYLFFFFFLLSLVEESMKTLQKECHWLRSMSWKICVRCTICMGNNTKCCKLHNENKCLHHHCGHYIPLDSKFLGCKIGRPLPRDALQPWIDVSLGSSKLFTFHFSCLKIPILHVAV